MGNCFGNKELSRELIAKDKEVLMDILKYKKLLQRFIIIEQLQFPEYFFKLLDDIELNKIFNSSLRLKIPITRMMKLVDLLKILKSGKSRISI